VEKNSRGILDKIKSSKNNSVEKRKNNGVIL